MSSNGARLEKETPHSEAAAADDNRWPADAQSGFACRLPASIVLLSCLRHDNIGVEVR